MIRAAVQPDDPLAPNAMTGVLLGSERARPIIGEMHVAGPDATMIRESAVELKRKK